MEDLLNFLSEKGYEIVAQTEAKKLYCNNKMVAVVDEKGLHSLSSIEDISMDNIVEEFNL